MIFDDLPEFNKDLKALLKKYNTLNDELLVVENALEAAPRAPPFSFRIHSLEPGNVRNYSKEDSVQIVKEPRRKFEIELNICSL